MLASSDGCFQLDDEDPARDVAGFKGSFIWKQDSTLKVLPRPRHMSRVQCLSLPEPGQQLSGRLSEPLAHHQQLPPVSLYNLFGCFLK